MCIWFVERWTASIDAVSATIFVDKGYWNGLLAHYEGIGTIAVNSSGFLIGDDDLFEGGAYELYQYQKRIQKRSTTTSFSP